jgi:hypothetical protein
MLPRRGDTPMNEARWADEGEPPMSDLVEYEKHGAIAVITVNNPP